VEENQDKINQAESDFSDFGDEDMQMPELEQDLVDMENKEEQEEEISSEKIAESEETQQNIEEQEISIEPTENSAPVETVELEPEISHWEELNSENSVVKKYLIYISKDFVPYIDDLTTDERSAWVNDAIQKKIDFEDEKKEIKKKKRLTIHLIVTIITFCALTPIALLGVNKAIMMTFENYKYSQDNFEKLYKQRFEKDKAYMRSIQYNREHEKKNKN